ncbi:LOW QUALITY PROTEIN: hypothetical protein PHMEG_0009970 [Phytophthora megakarya]|uniref:Uncharacterized protein n=1 Tax=Phytophthora megakarya TaxID=4795 RepID=A0A225WGW6_9STRA|nr:LOW QUALITY PROTEIN: hypothetical protein PHMEG_0009970 [Phytophthora megakarya]
MTMQLQRASYGYYELFLGYSSSILLKRGVNHWMNQVLNNLSTLKPNKTHIPPEATHFRVGSIISHSQPWNNNRKCHEVQTITDTICFSMTEVGMRKTKTVEKALKRVVTVFEAKRFDEIV